MTVATVKTERKFGMQRSGKGFRILSSTLYGDKPLAMVRETANNARDAHIEVGRGDVPFHMHLPTTAEPFYAIRDFGPGLSDDDMGNIYTVYFNSTKGRHSKVVAGQLGLGTKAPLAVAESFMVTSFHGGMKRVYTVFFDENDEPTLSPPIESPSDEPTGIEVMVQIEAEDYAKVRKAAEKALAYFDVQPIISGVKGFEPATPVSVLKGDYFTLTTRMVSQYTSETARAILGVTAYPIDTNMLEDIPHNLVELFAMPFDIQFPLGSLDFVPSREGLSYDKKLTLPTLKAMAKQLNDDLPAAIDARFAKIETEREVRSLFGRLAATSGWRDVLKRYGVRWNGIIVKSENFMIRTNEYPGVSFVAYSGTTRGVALTTPDKGNFVITSGEAKLFYGDRNRGSSALMKNHARDALRKSYSGPNTNAIYYLVEGPRDVVDALALRVGLDLNFTSAFAPEPVKEVRRTSVKMFYGDSMDKDRLYDTHVNIEDGGYYVLTKSYRVDSLMYNQEQWETAYKASRDVGLFDRHSDHVIVIPATLAKSFVGHPKWKEFYPEMRRKAQAFLKRPNNLLLVAQHHAACETSLGREYQVRAALQQVGEKLATGHPLRTFIETYTRWADSYNEANPITRLADAFRININDQLPKPDYDLAATWETFKPRYPMLKFFYTHSEERRYGSEREESERAEAENLQAAVDYVNLLDGLATAPAKVVEISTAKRASWRERQRVGRR